MDEEDILICHQCSGEADSLEPCRGGCGKELCSYCQPKCHECADRETIQRIEEEEEEEKRRKEEAEKQAVQPDRSVGQKVVRAIDWMTAPADGALRRELQYYDREFDMYDDDEAVRGMMKARWKDLPEWKKKMFRAKKKSEMFVARKVLRAGMKGGRLIRKSLSLAEPLLGPLTILKRGDSADDDWDDQDYDDYDEQDYEDHADGQDYEEDADIKGEAESYDEREEDVEDDIKDDFRSEDDDYTEDNEEEDEEEEDSDKYG